MEKIKPDALIEQSGNLLSLPEACIRVNELLDDGQSSAAEIAAVIIQDTALSSRLLKVVNSSFYGFPGRVETISRAITLVGSKELRDLAIISAAGNLFTGIPGDLINMPNFWYHSVSSGAVARALAKERHVLHPERLFVMGVLHDIGHLVLCQQLPEQSRDALLISKGRDELVPLAEEEVFGFTHQEVGYLLAASWKLPESLQAAIRWHHQPEEAEHHTLEATLVNIGSAVADVMLREEDLQEITELVLPQVWQLAGVSPEIIPEIVMTVHNEITELFSLLIGDHGSAYLS
ncbi:MAG: HDOD domain-containing protein [Candidatus Sedimenticola sp. (ex Thyasira tokunagai)]